MPAWTYDNRNREVRFVVDFFADAPQAVGKIAWKAGVRQGTRVRVGDPLATLTWDDGTQAELKAPGGCDGVIAKLNRSIDYEKLEYHPAEWALWLA